MTRAEELIIQGVLMGAYKAIQDATPEEKPYYESAYDIISRLAEQLKVNNPCKK